MAENSAIEWTDHTFNPWIGCQAVSPACDHCYAEKLVNGRMKGNFAERRRTGASYWQQPLRWNRAASHAHLAWDKFRDTQGATDAYLLTQGFTLPKRPKVFCASLADVFDNQVSEVWRDDLWRLIAATPHLDWLLLTKRPQNIRKMLPAAEMGAPDWGESGWPNVWLGTTVENQIEAARRIPHLLAVPATVHFLSCEPLLGPVQFHSHWLRYAHPMAKSHPDAYPDRRIDWVITGGESGPGARPSHPDWFRSLRDQCAAADVPFFFKQWGGWGLENPGHRQITHEVAEDGTLYKSADLAYPDGARRGDAIRARHDQARLHTVYRVGKRAAGRLLDGVEHNGMPGRA